MHNNVPMSAARPSGVAVTGPKSHPSDLLSQGSTPAPCVTPGATESLPDVCIIEGKERCLPLLCVMACHQHIANNALVSFSLTPWYSDTHSHQYNVALCHWLLHLPTKQASLKAFPQAISGSQHTTNLWTASTCTQYRIPTMNSIPTPDFMPLSIHPHATLVHLWSWLCSQQWETTLQTYPKVSPIVCYSATQATHPYHTHARTVANVRT